MIGIWQKFAHSSTFWLVFTLCIFIQLLMFYRIVFVEKQFWAHRTKNPTTGSDPSHPVNNRD